MMHRGAVLLLYLSTGIATAIPIIYALGWAVYGAGTSPLEYCSLFGSLILIVAALLSLSDRRAAAQLSLIGVVAIWSLYLPAIIGIVRVHLSDQQLTVRVFRWTVSDLPLTIEDANSPLNANLSDAEIGQLKGTNIAGTISGRSYGVFGTGKSSRAMIVLSAPVDAPVELRQPDRTSVVYVQYGKNWKMFPSNARTLERKIRIEPDDNDPSQNLVTVELASGAQQGFGILWPRPASRNSAR